jgi:hypothetical protein
MAGGPLPIALCGRTCRSRACRRRARRERKQAIRIKENNNTFCDLLTNGNNAYRNDATNWPTGDMVEPLIGVGNYCHDNGHGADDQMFVVPTTTAIS